MAVHKAIHIRTGRREDVEAVDAWLHDQHVEVVPLANAYAGCAFLLKHFDFLPDLALLGVDWLSAEELKIVRYLRETWPRVGIIIYGAGPETVALGYSARTLTCRSGHELAALTARRPGDVLAELRGDMVSPTRRRAPVSPTPPATPPEPRPLGGASGAQDDAAATTAPAAADAPHPAEQTVSADRATEEARQDPRAILTAAELAALLETDENS